MRRFVLWLVLLLILLGGLMETGRAQSPTRIAFTSNRDGNDEIYVMNPDGTGLTNLTNHPDDDGLSAWSPDGTKIAFTSNRDGNNEIYVMNADGTNPVRLTNNPANDGGLTWSPDGTKIAFTSNRDNNWEIYVMDADGSNPTNLTNHPDGDLDPDWSPDGTRIVFYTGRDGSAGEIYVMDADGTNQTPLTNNTAHDSDPAWSPDGTKIAFRSDSGGIIDLFVMDADGSNPVNLTNSAIEDNTPDWSPDGTRITFERDAAGPGDLGDIFVMDADGSNPVNLTNHSAHDRYPDWSPFPPVEVALSLDTAFGAPGDTVRIPLDLTTNTPIAGLQAAVLLDNPEQARFIGLEDTSSLSGFAFSTTQEGENIALVLFSDAGAVIPEDTRLATLVYQLDETAQLGTTIPLAIAEGSEISDSTGAALAHDTADGELQIGVRGDLTLDAGVSIVDVVRLVRLLIGKDTAPDSGTVMFNIADANADGLLDVVDVIHQVNTILGLLLKPAAGAPVTQALVSLGVPYVAEDGQMLVPVVLSADGLVAGLQATFAFDPGVLEAGVPRAVGSAADLWLDSHTADGLLRVVVFPVQAGQGMAAGQGPVLLIPVTLREGAGATAALTLSGVALADAGARRVPVVLGQSMVQMPDKASALPRAFTLHTARPNPFNPSTQIAYEVPVQAHIQLVVYNLLGQEVGRLVDGVKTPGRYQVTWDGRNTRGQTVASGVYVYRMTSSTGFVQTRRMTLVK
jgi:Tol biopolymer transport system component